MTAVMKTNMEMKNENIRHDRPYDLQNLLRRKTLRGILAHFHLNLINPPLFPAHFTEISILTLEPSNAIQKNLNTKFIDIQILRVITPAQQKDASV